MLRHIVVLDLLLGPILSRFYHSIQKPVGYLLNLYNKLQPNTTLNLEIKVKDDHTEKGQEIIRKAKKICKYKKTDNLIFSSFNHNIIGLDGYLADNKDKLKSALGKLKTNNYLIIDYNLKDYKVLKRVNNPVIAYNVPETENLSQLGGIKAAITDFAN